MARLANIVPSSLRQFDPRRHLTRGNVALTTHGILVTFKCTKTIQFGERLLHIPLLCIPGSPLCPVTAYRRMIALVPARRSCQVFLYRVPRVSCLSLSAVLFLSFVRVYPLWVFHMPIVSEVTPFDAERPLGRLVVAFPANLYNYTVIGPVILISFI